MSSRRRAYSFYKDLKVRRHRFDADEIIEHFAAVSVERIDELARNLGNYISTNLPAALDKRSGLADYRTNPYVLMTSASVMNLNEPAAFSSFLFNSKLYMGLETSFGKSVEAAFVRPYPINSEHKWIEAPEKEAESAGLMGLTQEEKALQRTNSVWREIDKSCVVGRKRFIATIKSGPNTINDTQVHAMTRAIGDNYHYWVEQSLETYPQIESLDIVIGLTYGTDRTTNNKENQILVKLLGNGFVEEDRQRFPGVLIDEETRTVRVYRRIGMDFWAFIGQPDRPDEARFTFLEVLLALSKALANGMENAGLEDRINLKLQHLSQALSRLQFPRNSLPVWIRDEFSEDQLFWFATAMTAFYDEGI